MLLYVQAYCLELEYFRGRIDRRLVQYKISMIEALLMVDYRLIKGLCLLKVAVDRPGSCVNNTLVCAGVLLGVGVFPRAYRSTSRPIQVEWLKHS